MSRTQNLSCNDCKITLWVGEGTPPYLYTPEKHIKALTDFLVAHATHHLDYQDSEGVDVDYQDLKVDKLDKGHKTT